MLRVLVLGGGWSREREVSLKSSRAVYESLDRGKYEVTYVDPAEEIAALFAAKGKYDLVFNLLHGKIGEDGSIQGFLDLLGLPYVGSGVLASSCAFNKRVSKSLYTSSGLLVPRWVAIRKGEDLALDSLLKEPGLPAVVKPSSEGSSIGVSICETRQELLSGIEAAFACGQELLVEEYVRGTEVTCCVIGGHRPYTLPLVEIVPKKGRFFNYEAKYTAGATEEICPARISEELARKASLCGIKAHLSLGCSVWSRTDMIIRGQEVMILETNTIPGMTENSLFPLAAKAAGIDFPSLLDRLIEAAVPVQAGT